MAKPGRSPEVSDEEILRAVGLHDEPVVSPSDVAEAVDMSNAGINNRLRQLADEGYLIRKEVGAKAVIYWLSDEGASRAKDSAE
jgi:predicted transcriptional regulator